MNKEAKFSFKYSSVKPTYDAMNKLQDTRFYINKKVLDRINLDYNKIVDKIREESDSRVSVDSKIKELDLTLELADIWKDKPIYSPVLLDFRGRTYYGSKYLTRSGSDWAKALLSVEPETIGYDGWDNLLIAAVDFRDKGVEAKMSRADKLSLAETQVDDFIAVANGADFLYAGEAGQFYAVCCDIAGAYDMNLRFDEYKSGVLLSRDASQSGPMLMGIATQDEMAMKYTNVLEDTQRYDLYEYVGSVMLKLLKETNFTETEFTERPEEVWKQSNWLRQNDSAFKAMAKTQFLRLFEEDPTAIRKWAKYPLMLFGYSAKEFCIASDLWDKMNLKYDWLTPVHCKLIADLFYKACKEAIPAVYSFMMGMKKFGTHARKNGTMDNPEMKDVFITTAYSGFPFMQDYKLSELRSKKVKSKTVRRHLSFKVYTDVLNRFSIDSGTAANVVHSIDADLLKMVVNKFQGTISTNHDAFFTTAGRINELDKVLRDCTYQLSNLDLIGNILSKYNVTASELGITVNERNNKFKPQNNEFCYS
jgi:DNA-directed RNA polymerase